MLGVRFVKLQQLCILSSSYIVGDSIVVCIAFIFMPAPC